MNIAIQVLKMIGGLVLLIYGMNLLSSKLKIIAGEKFENILKRATSNVFKGLLTGILITVALQSSTATTVLVVGFVNAGILSLRGSIPIIMGANIGTTITAQILRLASLDGSFLAIFSPSTFAPIFLIIGLILYEIKNKKKYKEMGLLFVGIGLMFTGLMTMIDIASGFSDLPILTTILTKLSNPILGVLAGAIIVIIVHSSAAAVGILQALSTTGFTTFANTIPIILGQNIGTCFTSILSSVGGSKNSKRTAAVHLYFNLLGTIIFMIGIYGYQYLVGFSFWNEPMDMGGIANFHLVFNIVSTIILLPLTRVLEKLTIITIPEDKNAVDENEDVNRYLLKLNNLNSGLMQVVSIAISSVQEIIIDMSELCSKNLKKAMVLIDFYDDTRLEHIKEREDAIDKIDITLANYLVSISSQDISENDSKMINSLLKMESEMEKVGDYAYKIAKTVETMNDSNIKFSNVADKELKIMYNLGNDIIIRTQNILKNKNKKDMLELEALRQISEKYRERYRYEHIERLKDGSCSVELGIVFIEILSSFEKIVSHCVNIAIASLSVEYLPKQVYIDTLQQNNKDEIESNLDLFGNKYYLLEKDNKLSIV